MGELGQAPRPAENARFLQQNSLAGSKIDYVQTSSVGYGTLVIPAGTAAAFNVQLSLYNNGDPIQPRVDFNDQISWFYMDFFIDNDLNLDYEYGVGGSLTAEQQKVVISKYEPLTHIVIPTQRTIYHITNFGSSSHTVYGYVLTKYIRLAT